MNTNSNHTWTYGSQKYTLYTIRLTSTLPSTRETLISTIVDPSMVDLLSRSLDAIPYPADPCFEIKQTEYKGAGMFAVRDINAGELIINEHPVVILPNKPLPEDSTAYDEAAFQLPEVVREEMFTLINCRPKEECPSNVEGIARTNALSLQFEYPKEMMSMEMRAREYGGIFLKINRCNHSCGPNASHKWNPATLSSSLYASRDIKTGEEITNTYVDPTLPRAKRIAFLQKNYGFTCDCPLLQNWFGLHVSYTKWLRDLCRPDDSVISSHLEALELVEQEGLHGLQSIFVEEIMHTYAAIGDGRQFEKWAKEVVKLCAVPDPELSKEMKRWIEVGEEGRRREWKKWASRSKQREQMTRKGRRARERSPSPFYAAALALTGDSYETD
ncbi:hypothetical protein BDQ17DRAFT_1344148 [Cyathus striatus]|nr:hypothetical protein BDQ17DRAFT_1344148 [Cyathus striatus]